MAQTKAQRSATAKKAAATRKRNAAKSSAKDARSAARSTGRSVADAAKAVKIPADHLNTDLHGSAEYRAHLVSVLASRAVAAAG